MYAAHWMRVSLLGPYNPLCSCCLPVTGTLVEGPFHQSVRSVCQMQVPLTCPLEACLGSLCARCLQLPEFGTEVLYGGSKLVRVERRCMLHAVEPALEPADQQVKQLTAVRQLARGGALAYGSSSTRGVL